MILIDVFSLALDVHIICGKYGHQLVSLTSPAKGANIFCSHTDVGFVQCKPEKL